MYIYTYILVQVRQGLTRLGYISSAQVIYERLGQVSICYVKISEARPR
jgi:hypothetical protein